jgi:hypothetical protein
MTMDAIDIALAAREKRVFAAANAVALNKARALRDRADEFPRMGDQWPMCSKERKAQALLDQAGDAA